MFLSHSPWLLHVDAESELKDLWKRQRSFDSRMTPLHTSSMTEPWDDIVVKLRQRQGLGDSKFQSALSGVEQVANLIAAGPLKSALFGWISLHDLCVQQTDTAPYSGPYLRISPLSSGLVEFRYLDTGIAYRQWNREVLSDRTCSRFTSFLRQLRWVALE